MSQTNTASLVPTQALVDPASMCEEWWAFLACQRESGCVCVRACVYVCAGVQVISLVVFPSLPTDLVCCVRNFGE